MQLGQRLSIFGTLLHPDSIPLSVLFGVFLRFEGFTPIPHHSAGKLLRQVINISWEIHSLDQNLDKKSV